MKFLQLLNGDFLNVEEILSVYFITVEVGFKKKHESLFSKIKTKNGDIFDFIDFPDSYGVKEKNFKFDTDEAIALNQYALQYVIGTNRNLLTNEEIEEEAWKEFDINYISKLEI
jgi:hypothetical protein